MRAAPEVVKGTFPQCAGEPRFDVLYGVVGKCLL